MARKVNVLGTKYTIIDGVSAEKLGDGVAGFCDPYKKEILILDFWKHPEWKMEETEKLATMKREVMRHEIVHAFLNESGLKECAAGMDGSWAQNEEMVDWLAIQGPKICAAWKEAGCDA